MDAESRQPEKREAEEREKNEIRDRIKVSGMKFGSMFWETLKRDDAGVGASILAAILILNQIKKLKAIDGDYQEWNDTIANTLVNLQFSDEEIMASELARPAEVKPRIIH